jgi:heme-degrading monooxygenase HmoA
MVTAIVRYDLAPSFTPERVLTYFEEAVPKFETMPGLIRKYFLLAEDGQSAGSVYLWESREQAVTYHNDRWKQFMQEKYGYRPTVVIYDCPVVVDNASGEIIKS